MPNLFGPIWSVPMHGAIVSRWALSASFTTGEARSTSHVVKMILAPWLISLSAQAFDAVGSSFCVSQVLSTILRPSTFFLLTFLISICAAASAGPSNGPIGPLESWAQPMMIGLFAAAECVRAAAAAAKTSAAAATITSAQRPLFLALMFLLSGPRLLPGPSFSTSS